MSAASDKLRSEIDRLCRSYHVKEVLSEWFKAINLLETYPDAGRNYVILGHIAMLVSAAKLDNIKSDGFGI